MPRIPQAQFNSSPSTRVEAGPVAVPQGIGQKNLANAATNMVRALATLQDQSERTEAYSKANDIKRRYQNEKVQFEAALQSVDAEGNYSYEDPLDTNPDPTKRKRYSGNIADKYNDLRSIYNEGQNEIRSITRADIGSDLLEQYIGDDLIKTQIRTTTQVNKKREASLIDSFSTNTEMKLNSLVHEAVMGTMNDKNIDVKLSQINNSILREAAVVAPVVGTENFAKLSKSVDRMKATASGNIIRTGLNANTARIADKLVASISDPLLKQKATIDLDQVKKETATRKNYTLEAKAKDMSQAMLQSGFVDDHTFVKAIDVMNQTKDMFIDPKYSDMTRERATAAAIDVGATAFSMVLIQERYGQDLSFLTNPERAPGSEGEATTLESFKEEIKKEMSARDISANMDADTIERFATETLAKTRNAYINMKENIAELVTKKNPHVQGLEKFVEIQRVAQIQGFGDVPLISKKEAAAFGQSMKVAKQAGTAATMGYIEGVLAQAGSTFEGTESFRRALATDLAARNPDNAFIVAAADAPPTMRAKIVEDAVNFQANIQELNISNSDLLKQFGEVAPIALRELGGSTYTGIRQAIVQRAAAIYRQDVGAGNIKKSSSGLKNAMGKAFEEFGDVYTPISTRSNRAHIVALNTDGGINYKDKTVMQMMDTGLSKALNMPQLSRDEKLDLIKTYTPYGADPRFSNPAASQHVPIEDIDMVLRNLVTIKSDPRYPNVVGYYINGQPLSKPDGSQINAKLGDIVKLGQETKKKQIEQDASVWTRR